MLKFCSLQDKKQLRLVNRAIYSMITDADNSLKHAYRIEGIRVQQLRQLADDFSTLMGVDGFEIYSLGEEIKYLHEKHPTLGKVVIHIQDGNRGHLRRIIEDCPILTGLICYIDDAVDEEIGIMVEMHPELQMFKIDRGSFGDQGLSFLFQLKYLRVFDLGITGANLQVEKIGEGSFSLNLSAITDSGLDKMLLKCGGRFVELNLSGTSVSFEGITAILPHLKKLNLSLCSNITDSGLDKMLLKVSDRQFFDLLQFDIYWFHPTHN